jgi:hypothetical protein
MDFAAFAIVNGGASSAGYISELTSTLNGIVLTPNPLGGQNTTGTISLDVDLKSSGQNFALGTDNWTTFPITTGDNNIAVGNSNMYDIVGNENVALGYANLRNINGGSTSNIVAIGARVMETVNGSHFNNIGIGHDIIGVNFSGDGNTVLGSNSLNTDGLVANDVVLLGNNSMSAAVFSTDDIVIGSNNLQQMGNSTNNLIIGHNNLQNATITGNDNIYIGKNLNVNVNESIDNILIGRDIEFASTDKRNCIVIGQNITLPAGTSDSTTIIGGSKIAFNGIVNPVYNHENYDTLAVRPSTLSYNYPFVIDTFSGLVQFTPTPGNFNRVVYFRNLDNLRNGNSTQVLNVRISFSCVYTTTTDVSTYFYTMSHALPLVFTGGQWQFLNSIVPTTNDYNQNTANNGLTFAGSNTTGNIVGGIVGGFYSLNTLGNELGYYVATLEDVYNAPCNYSVSMLVNGVGF